MGFFDQPMSDILFGAPQKAAALQGLGQTLGKAQDIAQSQIVDPALRGAAAQAMAETGAENIPFSGIQPAVTNVPFPGREQGITFAQQEAIRQLPPDQQQAAVQQVLASRMGMQQPSTATTRDFRTTIQRKKGIPLDTKLIEAAEQAKLGTATLESQIAKTQARQAEAEEKILEKRITDFTRERIAAQKEQDRIQNRIATQEAALEQGKAEFSNLAVNPNRWWQNQTTAGKLMAALSVALGGYSQGISGGRMQNVALSMINKAVDRDIALQQNAITRKGKELKGTENTLAYFHKRLGDAKAAEIATRDMLNQQVQMQLASVAQQSKAPLIRANFAKLLIANDQKLEQLKADQRARAFDQEARTIVASKRTVPVAPKAPKGEQLDRPSKEIMERIRNRKVARLSLDRFWNDYKTLSRAKITAGIGKAANITRRKDRIVQKLINSMSRTER
ncbi:MAG: hypothetical protein ACYTFK_14140 [Planctomycetota bacterium]